MLNKKPLVSIIIVNFNGLKWLRKCLGSLSSQSYKYYEIIVVDNASPDDSNDFIKRNYPKINLVKSKNNLGFAGGNNLGISEAKGEYILLINSDTWVKKDFINKLMNFYLLHAYDIIAPRDFGYDEKINKFYFTTIDLFGHSIYLENTKKLFYLSGVCLFFKKDFYLNTRGMDDNFFMYSEEVDWFWRLNLLKKKFTYVDDIFVYHAGAGSTGNGIKYKVFLWRNQNTLQMLLKNYAWHNLTWILPIYFLQNVFEFLFFLLIGKPLIAYSYIEGWIFNFKNFKRTMKERNWVQKNRKIRDMKIMKKMYLGFGKMIHIQKFVANNYL